VFANPRLSYMHCNHFLNYKLTARLISSEISHHHLRSRHIYIKLSKAEEERCQHLKSKKRTARQMVSVICRLPAQHNYSFIAVQLHFQSTYSTVIRLSNKNFSKRQKCIQCTHFFLCVISYIIKFNCILLCHLVDFVDRIIYVKYHYSKNIYFGQYVRFFTVSVSIFLSSNHV
jgi:hypothetical protein